MALLGSVLLSVCPILMAVGAVVMDYSKTHMFNPHWTPHAKFHNGQTISMSVVLGISSLWYAHAASHSFTLAVPVHPYGFSPYIYIR
jgi:hypothetical protein